VRLFAKFLLGLAVVIALTAAGILWYAGRSVHAALVDETVRAALRLGDELDRRIAPGFETRGEAELTSALLKLQRDTGGLGAFIADMEERVVAHTNVAEQGGTLADTWELAAHNAESPRMREFSVRGEPALELAIPLREQAASAGEEYMLDRPSGARRLGTVFLNLPLAKTLRTQAEILKGLRFVVLFSVVLSAAIAATLIGGMLVPLRRLSAAVDGVGRGDYGVRVAEESSDELGDLARSFNRMAEDLSRTVVSKDFLNRILENIQDLLVVTDAEGRVRLLNRTVCETLGYAAAELIGHPARILGEGPGEAPPSSFNWEDCSQSVENLELRLRQKKGAEIPVLLSASPLRDGAGRVQGLIIMAKDIRERRKFEQQLRMTEKLSAVGRLAAGVAHEINNPLGVILGFAQSAGRRIPPGDPLALPLSSIEREALRCRNLVQDLLTFSRQERARKEPVAVAALFDMTAPIIESIARSHGVRVERSSESGLSVEGDVNQLQQVLINLCSNAVDAMPEGGTLTLRGARVPGGEVVLEVSDTGTGMEAEVREKIFEPFFTTKPPGKGTGLGLALVHEIVGRHHGGIQVRSEIGRGTTFTVLLPSSSGAAPKEDA
jgi:PAS domain S-box-containing protein